MNEISINLYELHVRHISSVTWQTVEYSMVEHSTARLSKTVQHRIALLSNDSNSNTIHIKVKRTLVR